MSESKAPTEILTIGGYRTAAELKIEQLAQKLKCSSGHVSDLCNAREPVSKKIAKKMEALTGIPWHRWMENDPYQAANP